MQYNYNLNPIDFVGQYMRGRTFRQQLDREKLEARKQQQLLANAEQSAQFADEDRQIAADKRARLRELEEAAKREDAMLKDARQVKYLLDNGLNDKALEYGITRLQRLTDTGADTSDTQEVLDGLVKGDFERAKNSVNSYLAGMNQLQQKSVDKGRFKVERVGNNAVILDTVTGQLAQERAIPQTKTELLKERKLLADAQKAETEAQLKAVTAATKEEKKLAQNEMAQEALTVTNELLQSPNLSDITGTINPRLPTLSGASQDAINLALRLESLLTVDNLKLMSGVLTDRDIQFLTRVGSGLNITEGGIKGSEEGVKKRLQEIKNKMQSILGNTPTETQQSFNKNGFTVRAIN